MRYSRRLIISALFGSYGCRSLVNAPEDVITGPLGTAQVLLASGKFSSLRFHQHNTSEQERFFRIVDIWANADFPQNSTAIIRYEYRRDRDSGKIPRTVAACCDLRWPLNAERGEIANAFLSFFAKRVPNLVRHLQNALQNTVAAGIADRPHAAGAGELVGEVELNYHLTRQATFVTIGFYERHFYLEELQLPGSPPPTQVEAN